MPQNSTHIPDSRPQDALRLFVPITKVDAERRLVYGTLTEEVPDKSGEILDYASARPQFESWSNEIKAGSGGKSLGNVRAMHSNIAAGKLIDIHFDDTKKKIEGVARIVDDGEWEKVLEGVYTGFSLGGRYVNRWPDPSNPELMRYTPEPCEVSIVDNPCVPTATFTLVKAGGFVEQKLFRAGAPRGSLAKVGARHSKLDLERVQKLHDLADNMHTCAALMKATAIDLGADGGVTMPMEAEPEDGQPAQDIERAANTAWDDDIIALKKRIAELESQPLPMKGVARVPTAKSGRRFAESDDTDLDDLRDRLSSLPQEERAKLLMKVALANPMPGFPRR